MSEISVDVSDEDMRLQLGGDELGLDIVLDRDTTVLMTAALDLQTVLGGMRAIFAISSSTS